jgi:hypothetical protein
MSCWVYILAGGPGGTLYVGVTNNLIRVSMSIVTE